MSQSAAHNQLASAGLRMPDSRARRRDGATAADAIPVHKQPDILQTQQKESSNPAEPSGRPFHDALCVRPSDGHEEVPAQLSIDSKPYAERPMVGIVAAASSNPGHSNLLTNYGPQSSREPGKEMWDVLRQVLHLAEMAIQVLFILPLLMLEGHS